VAQRPIGKLQASVGIQHPDAVGNGLDDPAHKLVRLLELLPRQVLFRRFLVGHDDRRFRQIRQPGNARYEPPSGPWAVTGILQGVGRLFS